VKQLASGGTLSKMLQPFARGDAAPASGAEAAGSPGTATGAGTAVETPPAPPADESGKGGPLRGLLDILKKGKPHGSDIPGSGN
jgi:hypothetical protein